MRMELENAQEPNKNLQTLHHSTQQLPQQPSFQPIEEIPVTEIDGSSLSTALVPESHYWENVMQLAPVQDAHQQALQHQQQPQQQHHSSYTITDSLTENGWFSHYSNDASNSYALYSGASSSANSAEVFNYDQLHPYDPLGYHSTEVGAVHQQHYTELVDSTGSHSSAIPYTGVGSSSGDFYPDYNQSYQTFDSQGFGYHHSTGDTFSAPEEIYNYAEGSNNYGLNELAASNTCSSIPTGESGLGNANDAPKTESSNSSSEEDVIDMSSSLATIVKETMVSV